MTNAHKGYRFLRLHTIAKLGYVVVVMDCRGSAHRGLQFEGHIKNRLVSKVRMGVGTVLLKMMAGYASGKDFVEDNGDEGGSPKDGHSADDTAGDESGSSVLNI